MKKTISFNIATYNKLVKMQKKLQIKEFSALIDYICRKEVSNPKEIARALARDHMIKFQMYKDVVDSIEAIEKETETIEETETEKIYRESVSKIHWKNKCKNEN